MNDRVNNHQTHTDLPEYPLTSPASLFQFYRLFLALLMLAIFFTRSDPVWIGTSNPGLFIISNLSYLGFIIADLVISKLQKASSETRTYLMIFIDITFLTLIMHASGGVQTGMGMLLAVSIAAGSLMMRGRLALLFAALASLAVITEQLVSLELPGSGGSPPDFTQSALLGIAFFAIALLAHSLSLHIKSSEQLARQKQKDLADMAQLNEYVIDHMQAGVVVLDNHFHLRLINQAAWRLLGMPETTQHHSIDKISAPLASRFHEWRQQHQLQPNKIYTVKTGNRDLRSHFTPLGQDNTAGTLIFLEDTLEMTHQAQQMKLASIGRLTASIAHEIRNPLGAISHAGQLLSESPLLSSDDLRLTEIIKNNSTRVNEVIENILSLSRRDKACPELIALKPWLNDFRTEFLQASSLTPEQIVLEVDPADIQGWFDPLQMEQVLIILTNNAINHFHQIPTNLVVSLAAGYTEDKENIFLKIMDNGPGISTENQRQIFEPFFTTRNAGTGLGLYIARELSESNQARIKYRHTDHGGSCFYITLLKTSPQINETP